MSYQDDKRELLKLKQGIIEESDTIHEEEKPVYELHGIKRVENFIYHNKWYLVAGIFFAAVLAFLLITTIWKEQGDIRVLVITKDTDIARSITYKTQELEQAFELYCPDFDSSGYVHADVYNIDLSDNADPQYMLANVTKATSEIMYGEAQLFVADTPGAVSVSDEELTGFINLESLYPDCPFIKGKKLIIKDCHFARDAQYLEACPEDLFMLVREVTDDAANRERSEKANKRALQVIDNIVNGRYEGWVDDQGRIYGIKNDSAKNTGSAGSAESTESTESTGG